MRIRRSGVGHSRRRGVAAAAILWLGLAGAGTSQAVAEAATGQADVGAAKTDSQALRIRQLEAENQRLRRKLSSTEPKRRNPHAREGDFQAQAILAAPVNKGLADNPIRACSRESAEYLNTHYNLKGWAIPVPAWGNSVVGNTDCWRSNLAKYGIGILAYSNNDLSTNMLNHYVPPSNLQRYAGDRTFGRVTANAWLLYDMSRFAPDGQFQIGGIALQDTWIGFTANQLSFQQLSWYQTAFDRRLEFNIGYLDLTKQFVGTYVGGNIANVLGPSSGIQQQVGGGDANQITPAAIVKWNITDRFYDKGAISRSVATSAPGGVNSFLAEHYSDPASIAFTNTPYVFGVQYPTERELFTDEIGYKNKAAPADPFTWVRLTGYYNSSLYENLQHTNQQTHNEAVQFLVDRQIWQTDPHGDSAYKGIYAGATAAWANPEASPIYEDFGARVYTFGLFGRPRDQISLVWEHQGFSPYSVDAIDTSASCRSGAECSRHAQNNYSLIYLANIVPGVFAGMGVAYIDHPSTLYAPNELGFGSAAAPVTPQLNVNHAVNFLASLSVNL